MMNLWKPGAIVKALSYLRVDFAGMTDYIPAYGCCVNSTIGLPARLKLVGRSDQRVIIDAGSYDEHTFHFDQIDSEDNMYARAIRITGYDKSPHRIGFTANINCEHGSIGLSSSSSTAGLLIVALQLIQNQPNDPLTVAKMVQAIEDHWYGRQDQLSVAFGGMNYWEMSPGKVENGKVVRFGNIKRYPINLDTDKCKLLADECLLLYHSGIEEGAAEVLNSVAQNYDSNPKLRKIFEKLNGYAKDTRDILSNGKANLDWLMELGYTANRIREAHIELHPSVTNLRMDDLFDAGLKAGAIGIRSSGAGKRGVLTVYCKDGETARILRAMNAVDTEYRSESKDETYRKGHIINFNGFTDHGARAWFV